MPWSSLLSLLLVCSLWCAGRPVRAEEALDDERARAHFVAGESHFAAQRWSDAEREFALAYELSRRPEMLINLSRAHERNGELVAAVADLELLLSLHPETSYRGEAQQRLSVMRAQLAAAPPAPAVAPASEPAPAEAKVALPAAGERNIWPPSLPTLLVGATAIAAGAVALGTGLRAHGIYKDLEDSCGADASCAPSYVADRDHGRALSRASTALTFASIALAGTAAVLWVFDVKHSDERGHLAFGIDGAGARMRARF
jgi:hypothetical protein